MPNPVNRIITGTRVTHVMGHVGVVVKVKGSEALVKFTNTESWVWVSDLTPSPEEK